jgi:hypothetical protein
VMPQKNSNFLPFSLESCWEVPWVSPTSNSTTNISIVTRRSDL